MSYHHIYAKKYDQTRFGTGGGRGQGRNFYLGIVACLTRGSRRDRKREPRIPSLGPGHRGEFPEPLEVGATLIMFVDRRDVADLRPDTGHARLEATDLVARPAVARDLIEQISGHANLPLLGQELRRCPVEMKVDSTLVVGRRIDEIISEACYRRKFISGLRIEIRAAAAGIDGPMSKTEIGQGPAS